ncbi:MAG TPA: hypothetical protein PKN33_05035 [Phycisphaerae bacterium]|nr:hypothetical protein [Phycisphaerae bacterium]
MNGRLFGQVTGYKMISDRKKKWAMLVLSGGALLQLGGCAVTFGPVINSLLQSIGLTYLFGRGF